MDRDDVELGEEIQAIHGRKRSGVVVSIRLDHDDAERLITLGERSGKNIVEVAREALLGYLRASVE